jgi:hypothetical protein
MGGTIVDSRKDKERTTIVKMKREEGKKKNRVITMKMIDLWPSMGYSGSLLKGGWFKGS